MNLPKQSAPVSRDAIPGKTLNQRGVTASLGRTEFNRLFNLSGTCSCFKQPPGLFSKEVFRPLSGGCNRGFAPQCDDPSGGCTCVSTRRGNPPDGGGFFS
jgi:hypothetical protein